MTTTSVSDERCRSGPLSAVPRRVTNKLRRVLSWHDRHPAHIDAVASSSLFPPPPAPEPDFTPTQPLPRRHNGASSLSTATGSSQWDATRGERARSPTPQKTRDKGLSPRPSLTNLALASMQRPFSSAGSLGRKDRAGTFGDHEHTASLLGIDDDPFAAAAVRPNLQLRVISMHDIHRAPQLIVRRQIPNTHVAQLYSPLYVLDHHLAEMDEEYGDARRAMYWGVPVSHDLRAHLPPHRNKPGLVIALAIDYTGACGAAYSILLSDIVPTVEPVHMITTYGRTAAASISSDWARACSKMASGELIGHRGRYEAALVSLPDDQQESQQPVAISSDAVETAACALFRHLTSQTSRYMQLRHVDGYDIIRRHGDSDVQYVICTPFGMHHQTMQTRLRNACVQAGLVASERKHTVAFVSHTQAIVSWYAALPEIYAATWPTRTNDAFIVCDVRPGLVKLSSYKVTSTNPFPYNVKQCEPSWLYGGKDVDDAREHTIEKQARALLRYRLAGTPWDNDVDIDDVLLRLLDVCSVASFAEDDDVQDGGNVYVQFAPSSTYNDTQLGVRNGKLLFSRREIRALFQPVVSAIAQRLQLDCEDNDQSGQRPLYIVALGAFTERSDLYRMLQKRLRRRRIVLCATPACVKHNQIEKVVPCGALAWLMRSW